MKRILWIDPVGTDLFDEPIKQFLLGAKDEDTQLDICSLDRGPLHLEYHYYEALILADTLHIIKKAENDGYDAAVIGCFYDPGLHEAREICDRMVVTAPAESAMHIATTLGHSFSILVGRKKWIPKMHQNVVKYGFEDHLASFKSLGMGVHDFQVDPAETERRMTAVSREAVENDGAEAIVLGCTIEFGFYEQLQKEIGVPVLDATIAPLKYAEFLVGLRDRFAWGHSKAYGYESPPVSEIAEWKLPAQYDIEGIWGTRE